MLYGSDQNWVNTCFTKIVGTNIFVNVIANFYIIYLCAGHKGPVRRNTPVDEIPFLAVARSLGDLWSYNSALGEFVVSPKPDVRVIKIDTKKFRCLIFGTDGLWNVVRPQLAVDNVFAAEQLNEQNISSGGQREWINPSKNLVDKALERWSNTRMRADNTSVVIIMLDPPGPPKRDVILRASSTSPQQMEYLPNLLHPVDGQAISPKPENTENFTMFDHKTNKLIDLDPIPAPTSGVAIMTRYENTNGVASNYCEGGSGDRGTIYNTMQTVTNTPNTSALNYMNSFAESYSLFNANVDGYGIYNGVDTGYAIAENGNSSQQLHHADTYRLTRLETRTEQQRHSRHEYLNESGAEVLVTAYTSYEDHNYGAVNQAASSGASLPAPAGELPVESLVSETFPPQESFYESHRLIFSPDHKDITVIENTAKTTDPSNGRASRSQHTASNNSENAADAMETDSEFDGSADNDSVLADESIQINEISSSGDELLTASTDDQKLKLSSPQKLQANKTNGAHDQIPERKVTRSTAASQANEVIVRRSQRNDQKLHQILNKTPLKYKKLLPKSLQSLKPTITAILKECTKTHKENRSVPRRDVLHITKTTATTTTTNSPPATTCGQRTRSTSLQINNNDNTVDAGKRTLRSQNTKSVRVNTIQQNGASSTTMALRPNQVKTIRATTTNINKVRVRNHPTQKSGNIQISENVVVTRKRRKD